MIDDLWDFEDAAGSEARFRAAAAGATPEEAAVLTTQIARALGLQERYAEAHEVLDGLTEADGEAGVRAVLERGRLHRSAGDAPERAAELFAEASRLASQAGLAGLHVDALHMLAILGETPEEQIDRNRAALEVSRASTDPAARRWEASLLNNIGCALVDAERLDDALAIFEEALTVRRAQGQARETQIAEWMVGWTLRLLGRADEARSVQLALKTELEAAGIEDPYVDEELALLGD